MGGEGGDRKQKVGAVCDRGREEELSGEKAGLLPKNTLFEISFFKFPNGIFAPVLYCNIL